MIKRKTINISHPKGPALTVSLYGHAGRWFGPDGAEFRMLAPKKVDFLHGRREMPQWSWPSSSGQRTSYSLIDAVSHYYKHLGLCLARAFYFGMQEEPLPKKKFPWSEMTDADKQRYLDQYRLPRWVD